MGHILDSSQDIDLLIYPSLFSEYTFLRWVILLCYLSVSSQLVRWKGCHHPGRFMEAGKMAAGRETRTIDIMHSPCPREPIPNLIRPSCYRRQMTFSFRR
jgi:hypothetical protein